jgi:hypothetical protein
LNHTFPDPGSLKPSSSALERDEDGAWILADAALGLVKTAAIQGKERVGLGIELDLGEQDARRSRSARR